MNIEQEKIELVTDNSIRHHVAFKSWLLAEQLWKNNSDSVKSSITLRATENIFKDDNPGAVRFEFSNINYKIEDKIIKLQIPVTKIYIVHL